MNISVGTIPRVQILQPLAVQTIPSIDVNARTPMRSLYQLITGIYYKRTHSVLDDNDYFVEALVS